MRTRRVPTTTRGRRLPRRLLTASTVLALLVAALPAIGAAASTTTNFAVYAWGHNADGQLGDGTQLLLSHAGRGGPAGGVHNCPGCCQRNN